MGKLNIFEISFANMTGVFYSGQILQGHVTVELTDPMKMRGIVLNFEGKAYVHWTERHGSGKRRRTRHYSAAESYFHQDVLLHGIWSGQGSSTVELPKGRHTFPFSYQLPMGLPSSFEAVTGHVRFQVKCTIDKPWKFDHTTKRPFTVISILDLNTQPGCMNRVQGQNQKTLCCLCCTSGPIEASFHVDRQGYVPGEAIRLFAEISNGSNRLMDCSYVDLTMVTSFHATSKTRIVKQEVARIKRPSIQGMGQDSWTGEQLVIPPVPPSYLVGCNIIDIRYILQLNVDPSGPALDLEIPLEVVVGTIPLAQVVAQFPPIMPPMGATPSAPFYNPDMPNLPPPAYSECVTGKVDMREEGDSEHVRGEATWAPTYTYYDWGHTPQAMPGAYAKG